jgi:hypothetical protein
MKQKTGQFANRAFMPYATKGMLAPFWIAQQ